MAFVISAAGCAKKEAPKPKETKPAEAVNPAEDEAVKHKVLAFNLEGLNDKGSKQWEVNGQSAEVVSETEIKLDNIVAKAYGEEAEAVITADKGIYDKSKNNVRLEQNVKATIESSGAFASDFVGVPGEAAAQSKKIAPGEVKSQKTKTVITCDGQVEFNYERNEAYFDKNVKVTSDDGNIEADRITVNLEPQTKKVRDIIAEGNVKITRGENITYSEKATYVEAEKKVILTGRPKLVIYHEGGLENSILENK